MDWFNWNEKMRQTVYTGTETEWTGLIGKETPNWLVILGGRWNDLAVMEQMDWWSGWERPYWLGFLSTPLLMFQQTEEIR